MSFIRLSIMLGCLMLSCVAVAAETFQEGKQYKVITTSLPQAEAAHGKVQVLEFFSYGCPWCYRLEPTVQRWLAKHPKNVEFERVPVAFEPGWDVLSKAYYIAKAFGMSQKITPAMFAAIHKKNMNLTTVAAVENFFVANGLRKKDFESAYHFSPAIGAEMNHGKELMQQYEIVEIPTFIIAGKYKTSVAMVGGDNKKFVELINYLISKENKKG